MSTIVDTEHIADADAIEQTAQAVQKIADDEHISLPQARFWYDLRLRLQQRGFYEQVERDRAFHRKRIADYQVRWFPRQP